MRNQILLKGLAWFSLTIALCGCSATHFAYNRLDWLANWELRKFVNLTSEQEAAYRQDFQALWDWHRRQELPRYAADLRSWASLAQGVTHAEIARWIRLADTHWNRGVSHIAPVLCKHLQNLDEKQISSIREQLEEQVSEYREEFVTAPEAEIRQNSEERLLKRLNRWLGHVNAKQRNMIRHWSQQRPLGYEQWLQRQVVWRDRFMTTISQKSVEDNCSTIQSLFSRNPEGKTPGIPYRNDASRDAWTAFMTTLLKQMTPQQAEYLNTKLHDLADDLDRLSKQ